MSRFKRLKYYLGFFEANKIYWQLKLGPLKTMRLSGIKFPFEMRDTGSDYATFIEVLVKKDYQIPFDYVPKTIIDAGANIGLTALFFANKFPTATIVSIEPDKNNFAILKKNAAPYKNIIPVNKGIWSHASFLNVIDLGKGENSFIVEETQTPSAESVEAIGIADLMQQQGWTVIDLLKIDIEGTEKNIFETGFENWLPHSKMFFVETHDRMKKGCSAAIFKAVSQYNFSCFIAGENFLFVNEDLIKI